MKRKTPARSPQGRRRLLTAESASPAELAAIRRGRAEIRRGDYVTLEQVEHGLATAHRKPAQKKLETVPAKDEKRIVAAMSAIRDNPFRGDIAPLKN